MRITRHLAIPADFVREVMHYDPDTGAFTNKRERFVMPVGHPMGTRFATGYILIHLTWNGIRVRPPAHCLAWLYMTGEWPVREIDHINCDPADNRWCNLRLATSAQNNANTIRRRRPTASGVKGVSPWKGGLWRARIRVKGRSVFLGCFETIEAAGDAYAKAAVEHYGSFARYGRYQVSEAA